MQGTWWGEWGLRERENEQYGGRTEANERTVTSRRLWGNQRGQPWTLGGI